MAGGSTIGAGVYSDGTTVSVLATPNPGYKFNKWKQGTSNVSNFPSYTFTISSDLSLVATFTPVYHVTATSNPAEGGTTETDSSIYDPGDGGAVKAVPSPGYEFVNWTENGIIVGASPILNFSNIQANHSYVAKFHLIGGITISTSAAPAEGGITSGGGAYIVGDFVSVVAAPNNGYNFVNWTDGGAEASLDATYTFVASGDRTLVANFIVAPQQWSISANVLPAAGGSVAGDGLFTDGSQVTLTATASPGYAFMKWTEGPNDVSTSPNLAFLAAASRTLTANFSLTTTGVRFDFDATPTPVAIGQSLPLDQLSASITASFSSPSAAGFTVTNAATSGQVLSTFSGKYLKGAAGSQELDVQFSQSVTAASLNFALDEPLNLAPHSTLRLTAIDHSTGVPVPVATTTAQGTNHAGDSLATGTLGLDSAQPFDQIMIEVANPAQPESGFFVDNITITPTATGGWLSLINPNWNITLTDAGYSDLLLDNTPGFEGREYLSGEWGAAVGYTVGGTTQTPLWLERNFIFPDWTTNSNFSVVSPIALIGSNASGLPIAQSVLANNDLQITIRYEMIDTVVGMPMGLAPASTAGPGSSVNSNRFILNQSYTVKNISGNPVSNLQVFQFLHGLTSQHGVYDNHAYAGRFSDYRYDTTLGGIDPSSVGAAGASSTGLEDFIGFGSKLAPGAFEIGHYGVEGNGVDFHSVGKPSDGVHLSIESNWASAPYGARQGTDYFAPANRWIAGAERFELGTLADGQSATVDVMLSILTGTTVTIPGGGGDTGTGSCNGGASRIGGVDFEIHGITVEGTFFGQESEADEEEIQERITDGEFTLPTFTLPGGLTQVWNLQYNGAFGGLVRLKFNYNPALLPPGFDASKLTMWHFSGGAWEQLVGSVDTLNHTITVSTSTLSPFMLGLQTPNAIPQMNLTPTGGGGFQLSWTSDTTGWLLEESSDLLVWAPSNRIITQVGTSSRTDIAGTAARGFFRLTHP